MNDLLLPAVQKGSAPQDTDPYYNLVSLHLKGDVNTGRTYNAFSDASSNNFRLTNNGDVRGSSFSPYGTSWSGFFDGTGDYLSLASSADFAPGTGDFTIEAWVYPTASWGSYAGIFVVGPTTGGIFFGKNTSGFGLRAYGTADLIQTTAPSLNTWTHVAVSRQGTNLRLFVNGALISTVSNSTNFTQDAAMIGNSPASATFTGYISNLRLVKGQALMTADFSPTTSPLTTTTVGHTGAGIPSASITGTVSVIACHANRFIDRDGGVSTKAVTVYDGARTSSFSPFLETDTTTGSGYFDGSGDYLQIPTNTAFNLGTGAFCVEFWVYITSLAEQPSFINNNSTNIFYETTGSNRGLCLYASAAAQLTSSTTALPLNAWNHVVICRNTTGTLSSFANGNRLATAASNTSTVDFSNAIINRYFPSAAGHLFGYTSDLRMVKGSTPYDPTQTTITVPTALLSPIPNTQLLTLQERGAYNTIGFQDESEYQHVITRPSGANVAQGTFSPFSNSGWGNYFNGSTAYLSLTATSAVQLSNSTAFAIEFWVYPASIPSVGGSAFVLRAYNISSPFQGYGIAFGGNTLNTNLQIWNGTAWADIGAVSANTWTHIAVTYEGSGSTLRYFINGQQQGSATTVPSSINYTGTPFIVGARNSDFYLNGYISNLRIVKGSAVYTGNFLPSTTPLTAITNTSLLTCQSNRFLDNSTNNFTITGTGSPTVVAFSPFKPVAYDPAVHGGSGYFDGTGDYLTVPDNAAFAFGSGAVTIETWAYFNTTITSFVTLLAQSDNASAAGSSFIFVVDNTGKVNFEFYYGSSTLTLVDPDTVPINQWVHLAVARNASNTISLYVNGTRKATNASFSASVNDSSQTVSLGGRNSGIQPLNGYLSSSRIVKGTAVYDPTQTTITVPTAPLPLLGNTSLLLNFTNAGVIDSTGKNVIETVGNAGVVTTTIKKYGSGSISLGGNTDYLTAPASGIQQISGDFTLEAWVYPINAGRSADAEKYGTILSGGSVGVSSPEFSWFVRIVSSAITEVFLNINSTTVLQVTGLSISLNAWHHFVVVRSGTSTGNVKFYVDGALIGTSSGASTANLTFLSTQNILTGRNSNSTSYQNWLQGNIDDLRITRYARYVTGTGANANQMVFNGTNTLALPTKALPDRGTASTLTTDMAAPSSVEALVVAGGGAGGRDYAGGGGGGGAQEFVGGNSVSVSSGTNYQLTIGAGAPSNTATAGGDGNNSVFSSVTSIGGGGGGAINGNGRGGGSGGGAGGKNSSGTTTGGPASTSPSGQGNAGGNGGFVGGTSFFSGGGGGAGAAGNNGASGQSGNGGAGKASTISGSSVIYAGGGGGGGYSSDTVLAGSGGSGGGGAGGYGNTASGSGSAGTANTGGGGGGGSGGTGPGGAGGSGVVILAYPTSFRPLKASLGLVYTIDTVTRPGYRVYRFTAGTGNISW